jgi:hypothetical protein
MGAAPRQCGSSERAIEEASETPPDHFGRIKP